MSVRDKLQIILITYNRLNHVRNTFEQLFAEDSPIKDYELLVLDNDSTDGTGAFVKEFIKTHKNVTYQKNKYNIGGCGNIVRAMELAEKEYLWTICDDDKYDFSNWSEVEEAIENKEDAICVARYSLSDDVKDQIENKLFQMTFVPATILKTSVFNATVFRNAFDTIFTLFPQLSPIIYLINNNKNIYVVNKAIVENGMDSDTTDVSYTRGCDDSEMPAKTKTMCWIVGYANACSALKNVEIRHKTLSVAINDKNTIGGLSYFCVTMYEWYLKTGNWAQLVDLYIYLGAMERLVLKTGLTHIFLEKNQKDAKLVQILELLEGVFNQIPMMNIKL